MIVFKTLKLHKGIKCQRLADSCSAGWRVLGKSVGDTVEAMESPLVLIFRVTNLSCERFDDDNFGPASNKVEHQKLTGQNATTAALRRLL